MKSLFLTFVVFMFISLLLNYTNSQELYDFNLNTRVTINGHPHFKINYYPGSTNTNYKGDFYPDLETNPNVKVYTFNTSITIGGATDLRPYVTPAIDVVLNPGGQIADINSILLVPAGITITTYDINLLPTVLIKGKVVVSLKYTSFKTIIFPGGVFESIPVSTVNHTINVSNFFPIDYPAWDPLKTSSFISLGGTVTIRGFNTDSMWTGSNCTYTGLSYGSTFLRSFPFTVTKTPVFKMSGTRVSNNVVYTMNNYFNGLTLGVAPVYVTDSAFGGAGYIYMRPWTKNVFIYGGGQSSMVFTGPSVIDIQNAVFVDIGHTKATALNDNILASTATDVFTVSTVGTNPPDRYPITLLHNKLAVNIQNNMFMPSVYYHSGATDSSNTPRSYIGAKRSFGNLIGNAFVLKGGISGISLLYGTEQFDCSLNAFISIHTDTTAPASRTYPDIDYQHVGIVSTSPYTKFEKNAFEGKFRGGAIQFIPLQSRSTIAGLTSDMLLGTYSGLTQDNTVDYKTNNVWNSVVIKESFFAGEAEFRVIYPTTTQPPLKFTLFGGWFINQRTSLLLAANQANIELFYDSPYIANSLAINDRKYAFQTNTHTGVYNAVSVKNSIALAAYTFFADSFSSKYISITDSKFSHYSSTPSFIKQNTNQLYMSNVNGTKTSISSLVPFFFPLFNLSPLTPTSSNQITMSFIPNFDYSYSDGQSISYIVNDVIQTTVPNIFIGTGTGNFVVNVTQMSNLVTFPSSNGPTSVLVSAKSYTPTGDTPYTEAGPFFANTYVVDTLATNFYLGIDLTPDVGATRRALSIFTKQWTKCGWISSAGLCTTTGVFSKVTPTPSTIIGSTGNTITAADELSMLSSYLTNDAATSTASTITISLPASSQFKIYLYSYNPSWTGSNILNSLPLFTIKIGGKYQEPFSRSTSPYQKYQKFGPFFWNNDFTTTQNLVIEWAADNLKYPIPISGIEIYSSITTPYSIPIDSTPAPIAHQSSDNESIDVNSSISDEYDNSSAVLSPSSFFSHSILSFITCTFIILLTKKLNF